MNIDEYVPMVRGLARKMCRWGIEDPEELESDALLGLTYALRAYKPECGPFFPYLHLRCRRAIGRGRQLRSGTPRPLWDRGEFLPRPVALDAPISAESEVTLKDLLEAPEDAYGDLRTVVAGLPARERLVVSGLYSWGLSQSEIAALLGCSQMQVSRINARALSRLREELERA